MREVKEIGEFLKDCRKLSHVSARSVAEKAGLSIEAVRGLEAGKDVRISTLIKAADALDIHLSNLFMSFEGISCPKRILFNTTPPGFVILRQKGPFDFEGIKSCVGTLYFVKTSFDKNVRLMRADENYEADGRRWIELVDNEGVITHNEADTIQAWEPYSGFRVSKF